MYKAEVEVLKSWRGYSPGDKVVVDWYPDIFDDEKNGYIRILRSFYVSSAVTLERWLQ